VDIVACKAAIFVERTRRNSEYPLKSCSNFVLLHVQRIHAANSTKSAILQCRYMSRHHHGEYLQNKVGEGMLPVLNLGAQPYLFW